MMVSLDFQVTTERLDHRDPPVMMASMDFLVMTERLDHRDPPVFKGFQE